MISSPLSFFFTSDLSIIFKSSQHTPRKLKKKEKESLWNITFSMGRSPIAKITKAQKTGPETQWKTVTHALTDRDKNCLIHFWFENQSILWPCFSPRLPRPPSVVYDDEGGFEGQVRHRQERRRRRDTRRQRRRRQAPRLRHRGHLRQGPQPHRFGPRNRKTRFLHPRLQCPQKGVTLSPPPPQKKKTKTKNHYLFTWINLFWLQIGL